MINKMILQGRLTADPELRQTQSGISVCSFTVAWSEKRNEIETKCFLRCTAWRGTAEFLSKYFSKGKEIVVEGKLNTREWEDNEGNKRSSIELAVDAIHFCGCKSVDVNISASGLKDEEFETIETGDTLPF
jgi:single-strand DNA-binding protein